MNDNQIHPSAIVETGAMLGKNNKIGPFTYISKHCVIGDNNIVEGHVSLGRLPEHRASWEDGSHKDLVIGSNNRINSFCTIDCGYERDTIVGDNVYLLRGAHVGHDASIGSNARIHCNSIIGGHVSIGRYCYLGLGCIILPKVSIGDECLVGAGSLVNKSIPFGQAWWGNPASFKRINKVVKSK